MQEDWFRTGANTRPGCVPGAAEGAAEAVPAEG